MPYSWRSFRPVLLALVVVALCLPLASPLTYAQEGEPDKPVIIIQGTFERELDTLIENIRDAYPQKDDVDIQLDLNGPSPGFSALCAGEADLVLSAEPIDDGKIAECDNQNANFIETVIAYEAVVLLAPESSGVTCLDTSQVFETWALDAPAEVTWADLAEIPAEGEGEGEPLTFYGPQDYTPPYGLFAQFIPNTGKLREDIVPVEDVADILDTLTAEGEEPVNAMGFMSLADYDRLEPERTLSPVEIRDADGVCTPPTVGNVASRTYPLGAVVYLYVNADSAARPEVESFMEFVLSDEGAPQIAADEGWYTLPLEASYERGLNNIITANVGRTFTRPVTPVSISTAASGSVHIVGTTRLENVLTGSIVREFSGARYVNAQVQSETLGNTAGWEAFCGGMTETLTTAEGTEQEVVVFPDVLQTTRPPTEDEWAQCAEEDPYLLDLGYEALVFVVPAGNDWIEDDCLTPDMVRVLFGAGTGENPAPTMWNEVNADWPEETLLLVLPPVTTGDADYLAFTLLDTLSFVFRDDTLEHRDPLYRVQGVANTAEDEENPNNALTFLLWSEFQKFENKDAVKLLKVQNDAGACVAPELETFETDAAAEDQYPLSYPMRYYFSQKAFTENAMARVFFWHFFDPTTLDLLAEHPFAGLDVEALRDQRDAMYDMLAAYEVVEPEEETEPTGDESGEASDAGDGDATTDTGADEALPDTGNAEDTTGTDEGTPTGSDDTGPDTESTGSGE